MAKPDLLTVREVAKVLRCSKSSVYNAINEGRLRVVHWSLSGRKRTYVPRQEVERFRAERDSTSFRQGCAS